MVVQSKYRLNSVFHYFCNQSIKLLSTCQHHWDLENLLLMHTLILPSGHMSVLKLYYVSTLYMLTQNIYALCLSLKMTLKLQRKNLRFIVWSLLVASRSTAAWAACSYKKSCKFKARFWITTICLQSQTPRVSLPQPYPLISYPKIGHLNGCATSSLPYDSSTVRSHSNSSLQDNWSHLITTRRFQCVPLTLRKCHVWNDVMLTCIHHCRADILSGATAGWCPSTETADIVVVTQHS